MRIFVALGMMCLGSMVALSQTVPARPKLPPGFVDGSISPDQIPDHAAYRLIFIHLMGENAGNVQQPRVKQELRFAKVGLPDADVAVLKRHLGQFESRYSQWSAQKGQKSSAAAETEVQTMVLATRDAVIRELTPDGASKFIQHVQREKAHMIVRVVN